MFPFDDVKMTEKSINNNYNPPKKFSRQIIIFM